MALNTLGNFGYLGPINNKPLDVGSMLLEAVKTRRAMEEQDLERRIKEQAFAKSQQDMANQANMQRSMAKLGQEIQAGSPFPQARPGLSEMSRAMSAAGGIGMPNLPAVNKPMGVDEIKTKAVAATLPYMPSGQIDNLLKNLPGSDDKLEAEALRGVNRENLAKLKNELDIIKMNTKLPLDLRRDAARQSAMLDRELTVGRELISLRGAEDRSKIALRGSIQSALQEDDQDFKVQNPSLATSRPGSALRNDPEYIKLMKRSKIASIVAGEKRGAGFIPVIVRTNLMTKFGGTANDLLDDALERLDTGESWNAILPELRASMAEISNTYSGGLAQHEGDKDPIAQSVAAKTDALFSQLGNANSGESMRDILKGYQRALNIVIPSYLEDVTSQANVLREKVKAQGLNPEDMVSTGELNRWQDLAHRAKVRNGAVPAKPTQKTKVTYEAILQPGEKNPDPAQYDVANKNGVRYLIRKGSK